MSKVHTMDPMSTVVLQLLAVARRGETCRPIDVVAGLGLTDAANLQRIRAIIEDLQLLGLPIMGDPQRGYWMIPPEELVGVDPSMN